MSGLVITQKIDPQAIARLDSAAIPYTYAANERPWPRKKLLQAVAGAEAVICLLTDQLDAGILAAAPRLRMVANVAVGFDNIDVAAATTRGIGVSNTPDVLTETTADLAFSLLLALARRIPEADDFMRSGSYTRFEMFPELMGIDVYGQTLGIVGLGRIGTAVARRGALGFGMRILYTANSPKPDVEAELGAVQVSFQTLLAESDFISIHTPLLAETRHLFTLDTFHKMKPTACLVNTARGPIIKEADLVDALREKLIAGAALDVFEHEPQLHPELATMKEGLIVTPHVGSATGETRRQMCMLAVENILAAYAGVRPPNLLNPAVWPLKWEHIQP